MNSIIEARQLTLKYLGPVVKKHEFDVKVSSTGQAKIERRRDNGIDVLAFEMLNYNPRYRIRYAFNKVNFTINDILLRLQQKVSLATKVDKNSWFLFFSYNTLHDPSNTAYLPDMETETDAEKCVGLMISFIEGTGLPLLGRFDDLREVDRVINSQNPWETDWRKPYVFGSNFHLKRLIISKLAGLNSYERILNLVIEFYSSRLNGEFGDAYKAGLLEAEELDKILKDVKPLY